MRIKTGALDFKTWCNMRGEHRARFWRLEGFVNPERARYSHWVLKQRHWPESHLTECLADLAPPVRSRRTKRRKASK
jgi:hypothetical protein